MEQETQCVEVSGTSGEVIGYAIFFSGSWDAYILLEDRKTLREVACNVSRDQAIESILEQSYSLTPPAPRPR